MTDLTMALGDAARVATGPRSPIDPAPVLQRVRRRRAARHALLGTVVVASAAMVALAGVSLAGWRDVEPAATPEPTTTEPAPTTGLTCGGLITDVPALADPEVVVEAALADVVIEPSEPLTARVTIAASAPPSDLVTEDLLLHGLDYAVAQEGVVVGIGTASVERGSLQALSGRQGFSAPVTINLTACDGQATPGGPLPAGDYQLYAGLPMPATDSLVGRGVALGGPWAFTVQAALDDLEGRPALEDLIISPAGLGPLTVGLPPETNPGAAMIVFDEDYCIDLSGGWWDETVQGPPGEWVPTGYPAVPPYWDTGSQMEPFRVSARETVLRIDILSPLLRTSEGIGLGSTLAELRDAHADVVEQTMVEDWTRAWVLQGPEGTLLFETADDHDGYVPGLTEETIVSIRITAPGVDYTRHTRGWGDVVGNCGLA